MVRTPRTALLAAALCAAGLVVTTLLVLLVPAVHAHDITAVQGFQRLQDDSGNTGLKLIAHTMDPAPYTLLGSLFVLVALLRRRPGTALAIAVLLVATGMTTQVLKHTLDQPEFPSAFPSGHATAAMTCVLCGILAAPARLRAATALVGAACAIAVSFSILALKWHTPTDVVGGYLVAGTWAALAIAVLLRLEAREGVTPAPAFVITARGLTLAGLCAAAAAVGAAAARFGDPVAAVSDRSTAVASASCIALLALALPAWLARTAR